MLLKKINIKKTPIKNINKGILFPAKIKPISKTNKVKKICKLKIFFFLNFIKNIEQQRAKKENLCKNDPAIY